MVRSKMIFSKSLTATDIKKRMAIPTAILRYLPGFNGSHEVKIHLMYGTRMWPVVCSIRKTGYYKKPVFSGGWIDFVRRNNFNVGDKLTLYKVLQDEDEDEADSFYYRVEVENHARQYGDVSSSLSRSHEVDETPGTSHVKACSVFENEQEKLLTADAVPVPEEAVTELVVDVAADAPIALVDHVIDKPKPSSMIRIFGADVSTHEATSKAHFKTEEESKMKLFGITKSICLGEPPAPVHSCYTNNEQREVMKLSFDLAEDVAMACGTSQAVGDGYYYRSRNERLSLDMTRAQPTAYGGEASLALTLAPPVVDGRHRPAVLFVHPKPEEHSSPEESY